VRASFGGTHMAYNKRFRNHPIPVERARQLRREQTHAEQKLWSALRASSLGGYKFRRQHPIGRFIVDFYCSEARLVVEIDGDVHAGQEEYDQARSDWLEEQGYRVIRFRNEDLIRDIDAVGREILVACQRKE
jgi:very-short-patch-repair endonuclease